MKPDLAIVIPAFKADYFEETLKSIQAQTDPRFTLYIFDDASPENLKEVVDQIDFNFDVRFTRFNENWGGESLVKQWERCIQNTQKEEWIWLFSDDDQMAPDCVESFYQTLENSREYAAYRFDTKKILADGEMFKENTFPVTFDAIDFLNLKLSYEQESYIVEYIFSRKAYNAVGGFPDLPLAWASDDLFCTMLADYGQIRTIKGGTVQWRYSDSNISGKAHRANAKQKLNASLKFVNWIMDQKHIREHLKSEYLPVSWALRQLKSMRDQIKLYDELHFVHKLARIDKRIWNHYLQMKKNSSKLLGWLKRFSL